jgi:hypothetical protein
MEIEVWKPLLGFVQIKLPREAFADQQGRRGEIVQRDLLCVTRLGRGWWWRNEQRHDHCPARARLKRTLKPNQETGAWLSEKGLVHARGNKAIEGNLLHVTRLGFGRWYRDEKRDDRCRT